MGHNNTRNEISGCFWKYHWNTIDEQQTEIGDIVPNSREHYFGHSL
jgi:hypothetical protein